MSATTTAARPPCAIRNRRSTLLGPGGPWSSTAPAEVQRHYQVDSVRGWKAWRRHLAGRKLRPIAKLFGGSGPPQLWALPWDVDLVEANRHVRLAWRLATSSGARPAAAIRAVEEWLVRVGPATADRASSNGDATVHAAPAVALGRSNAERLLVALESIAWSAALPRLAALLPGETWWVLANRLVALAKWQPATICEPLVRQILTAELPLTLAYVLDELEAARELARTGRDALSAGFCELLDEHGLVDPPRYPILRPLVATWTRARTLAAALELRLSGGQRKRFARSVQQALRLTRADGRPVLAPLDAPNDDPQWIEAAVRLVDDRGTTAELARLVEKGASKTRTNRRPRVRPSFEDEGASLAVLRPNWLTTAPRLGVVYGDVVRAELSVGATCLWSGTWDVEVRVDGRAMPPRGDWEQVCWESDDDIDYLELVLKLQDEVSVERHIALARNENVLLLADAVLGIGEGTIDYRGTINLGGAATFVPAAETREGTLVAGRRPRARILPLALGEWRRGPSPGTLEATADGLELVQTAMGQALFAPLFLDLDSRRLRHETTWRQLTVGQKRQIVAKDAAVGYRAQAATSQWLIYRSLAEPDIRTVLATNLMHEFLLGSLQSDGQVKTLVEIE